MKRIISFILMLLFTVTTKGNLYSISVAELSSKNYRFTTETIRDMKTMIRNFKNADYEKKYDEILKKFEDACHIHYSRDYDSSTAKFYNIKIDLMNLLEEVANNYISRTTELLKTSSIENKSLDVFINFGKNNSYNLYFKKPFNPLKDVKPYTKDFQAKDFHYFKDAETIERYLKNGYYHLSMAKAQMNDSVIPYLKNKKRIKTFGINYIIDKYLNAIKLCRIAKESGIEIYRISNYHNTGLILEKYNITVSQITPIFDDRIPEKYKVDAIDNRKLLMEIEEERRKKALAKN